MRNGSTAPANGHTLRDVRASGPVGFLNDANAHNEQFEPTRVKRGIGRGLEIDWDENPAANKVLREIDLSPLAGR